LTMWKSLLLSLLSTSAIQAARDVSDTDIGRIIGGSNAEVNDYPYFVQGSGCAGALVAPDIVLWAAHCQGAFDQKELLIGAYNYLSPIEGAQTRFCDTWIFDDRFDYDTLNFDFSICKLDKPVTNLFNPKNISLVINFDDSVPTVEDDELLVMGFGDTNPNPNQYFSPLILQDVAVPYVTNEVCNEPERYDGLVTDQMLCAGFPDIGEKDACQGDSGGPIVRRTTDEDGNIVDEHVGIVSWGFGCADPLYPGVYSRTSQGTDWIVEKTCNELNSPADYCPEPPQAEAACDGEELIVTTLTDQYGPETTWEVVDADSFEQIKYRRHLVNFNQYEHAPICLQYDRCYNFNIFDSFGDGLCDGGNCNGFYKGEINGQEVFENSAFSGSSATESFCTGPAPDCVDETEECSNRLSNISDEKLTKKCQRERKFQSNVNRPVFDICPASCAPAGLGPCAQ